MRIQKRNTQENALFLKALATRSIFFHLLNLHETIPGLKKTSYSNLVKPSGGPTSIFSGKINH